MSQARALRHMATPVLLVLAVLVVLHACREVTDLDPSQATTTSDKQLIISGAGTGSGTVTVPLTAGRRALTCVITAGQAAATDCSRYYPHGTVVTLTASPATDNTFTGWTGACSGTGTCTVSMTQVRRVTASFALPSSQFPVSVTGGGSGSGTVSAGIPPGGISCIITAGQESATGCTATYPAQTALTLTAVPGVGQTFAGWGGDCTAAGSEASCQLTVSQASNVTAIFSAPGVPAPEATLGKWSSVFATPVIAVHLTLLQGGNVLLWGHTGQPWLWNPSSYPSDPGAGFTLMSAASEMFCAGHAFMPDGGLLVVGGHDEVQGNGFGIPDVNIFRGTAWETAPALAEGRWYPTATTIGTGEVVVTAGTDNNQVNVRIPEVWNGIAWRQLTGASFGLPYYPRMFTAPNGWLFYAGQGSPSRYLDPAGAGSWTTVGSRVVPNRNYGAAVMLDGKVLYVGGGGETSPCTIPPANTAEIIDLYSASPAWRAVGSMAFGRRQLNATILADGKVLATGGTAACGFSNESGSVYAAEVWDPTTEQWSTLSSMHTRRVYHSTALLLPDGRVLSAGGGDNVGSTNQYNAEIFTPPYLFNPDGTLAPRPRYSLSSTALAYGQAFTIQSSVAATITKVILVRHSSVTHAFNESQQRNTLSFTSEPDGQSLTAAAPPDGNIAPPGPYLLFLVNDKGVPSVAQTVSLR